ncbi:MAG: HIT domain-containing protein [Candidatus Sericytochromatia bacterium]|nr:HIT domain-containing protein [Candidatus Sericytochromatia bacterium]
MERHNLFVPNKLAYARGERPSVPCILCAAIAGDPKVTGLMAATTERFAVLANLYPYNPGHMMIVPQRHIEDVVDFTEAEVLELHQVQVRTLGVLRELYTPTGINLGYNIGVTSGASIPHLHLHLVPRHQSEQGFMDIIGGGRVIVEDPCVTLDRFRTAWERQS